MNSGTKDGVVPSRMSTESQFRSAESRRSWAHVEQAEPAVAHNELLDGTNGEQCFGFAMRLPPLRGRQAGPFGTSSPSEVGMTTTFPNAPPPDPEERKAPSVVRQAWQFTILNVKTPR